MQSDIFATVIVNLLMVIYCLWPKNAWFLYVTFFSLTPCNGT